MDSRTGKDGVATTETGRWPGGDHGARQSSQELVEPGGDHGERPQRGGSSEHMTGGGKSGCCRGENVLRK